MSIVPNDGVLQINDPRPLLSILIPKPFKNPRAVAQQALTTFSNIDYIERYVAFMTRGRPPLLRAFNLDPAEREEILADLEWMGITESLLFPGLEGSFRTLARKRFPR
jgi:hypothetical protein